MEKFSLFTDKATGVNPFTVQPFRPGLAGIFTTFLVALLRLPFAAVLFALLIAADAAVQVLPVGSRLLAVIAVKPLASALLWFMGFTHVETIESIRQQVRVK